MDAPEKTHVSNELGLHLNSMLTLLYELQARFLVIEQHPDASKFLRFATKQRYNQIRNSLDKLTEDILAKFTSFDDEFKVARCSDALSAILEIIVLADTPTKVKLIQSATDHYCKLVDKIVKDKDKAAEYKDFMRDKNKIITDRLKGDFYNTKTNDNRTK